MILHLQIFCRVLLGVVFVLAVAGKLRHRPEFIASVTELGSIPHRRAVLVASAVLAAEGAVVVTMVAAPVISFLIAAALLAAFSAALLRALIRGRRVSCHCFGSAAPVAPVDLLRNGVLLAATMTGLATAGPVAATGLAESVLTGLIAVTAAVATVHVADIVLLVRPAPDLRIPGGAR